jgi:hypothetical protein
MPEVQANLLGGQPIQKCKKKILKSMIIAYYIFLCTPLILSL